MVDENAKETQSPPDATLADSPASDGEVAAAGEVVPMPEPTLAPALVLRDEASPEAGISFQMPFSKDEIVAEIARVKRNRIVCGVLGALLAIVVCAAIALFVLAGMPSSMQVVSSNGMAPTLSEGQIVVSRSGGNPTANAVVVYRDAEGAMRMGRVVGLSREWVNAVSNGTIAISSSSLEGGAAEGIIPDGEVAVGSRQVPDRAVFVMEDSERGTIEALYDDGHYIPESSIVGFVTYRIWPVSDIGPVA